MKLIVFTTIVSIEKRLFLLWWIKNASYEITISYFSKILIFIKENLLSRQ